MDRQTLSARIKALLAKTVDRGCTEAEAMAAAAKAKELMDVHQLNLSDVELEEEGCIRGTAEDHMHRKLNIQDWICAAVGAFCEVKVWGSGKRIVFFGLRSDVELANWLLKSLEAFIWSKADAYGTTYMTRRTFAMGCANRISERLHEEARNRKARQPIGTGRSVMVIKNAIVQREFNKLGLHLGRQRRSYTRGDENARAAGYKAGDGAHFGRPINGGGEVKRLA